VHVRGTLGEQLTFLIPAKDATLETPSHETKYR
jgi:hypothetical protein